jgi:xylitol oxidase
MSEIRTVAADELWLSPCYGLNTVAIHFSWNDEVTEHATVLGPVIAALERALEPCRPRPHWGKLFSVAPDVLERRYERLPEFRAMVRSFDPNGKFRNEFLSSALGL